MNTTARENTIKSCITVCPIASDDDMKYAIPIDAPLHAKHPLAKSDVH